LPNLSSLLLKIPDEFKPLAAIGVGALILVSLVLFHGLGLHRILVYFKRVELRLQIGRPHLGWAGLLFGWAVFLMLTLHILEIMFWAYALNRLGLILRPSDAIYFCANAYTTLGYGAVDLGQAWRNISPIIAISGLFTFAWTTSSLVSIVSNYLKLVEKLEEERLQQLRLRSAAHKARLDAKVRERVAENQLWRDAKRRASDAPFFERRKIWKEEKEKIRKMRDSAKVEIKDIGEKESHAEDSLGQPEPQDGPEVTK
jgi:signal transduction histidine kinase